MSAAPTHARDLAYYMALPYTFTLIPDLEAGGFAIKVNELSGCMSQGDSAEEAYARIREAMEGWLEVALEDGLPIPEPGDDAAEYSGKILVRVPKTMHRALMFRADAEGVSLNLFIATELGRAVGEAPKPGAKRPNSVDRYAADLTSKRMRRSKVKA